MNPVQWWRSRRARQTNAVLCAIASGTPDNPAYGYQICRDTGIGPGAVYPILERLAENGWIDVWDESEQAEGRPCRRFYALSLTGRLAYAARRSQ